MRNVSSTVLSLAAMVLSSLTTYLTFFDARYTLTATIANVQTQTSRGYGSNGETKNIDYRFYVEPLMIISNRGTRPVVLTDMKLVKSTNMDTCEPTDFVVGQRIDPIVMEPGTVEQLKPMLGLEDVEQNISVEEEFTLQPVNELWCLQWVAIDPNGGRHEPMTEAFRTHATFKTVEGENYPEVEFELDAVLAPQRLVSRGF